MGDIIFISKNKYCFISKSYKNAQNNCKESTKCTENMENIKTQKKVL
jgi:hypothetical protein